MAASVGGFLTRHHLVRAQWPVRRPGPRALRLDRPRHHRRSDLRGGIAFADNRDGAPLDQTGGSGRIVSVIARTKATAQGMHAGRPNMRR